MNEKPFYASKKFVYAVLSLVAAAALAIIPAALGLSADVTDSLNEMVPFALAFGFALISGHTVMDALSMSKGAQLPTVDDAMQTVIDVVKAEIGAQTQEVAPGAIEAQPKAEQ